MGRNEGRNQLLNEIISVGGYGRAVRRRGREKKMSHKYAGRSNISVFLFICLRINVAKYFFKTHLWN